MKKLFILLMVLAAVATGLLLAHRQMSQERVVEAEAEEPIAAESRVRAGADGGVVITLDAQAQRRLGLVIATPAPGRLPREVRAYGRVLDPAPLAALTAERAAAAVALEASSREFQRVKGLFEQGQTISQRVVEAAEAAVKRDQIGREAVELKLAAAWGASLAGAPDLPGLVRALVSQQSALVRLDLPAGESAARPAGARLFALDEPDRPIQAEYVGPAPDVDAQVQGRGLLFLVKAGAERLRPGQTLLGRIQQPGEPLAGVVLPASAVVRAAGLAWVYLQSQQTNFTRRPVALEHPVPEGWLVTSGLSAQDRLVVTGAQMLFSEEQKARLQVGD